MLLAWQARQVLILTKYSSFFLMDYFKTKNPVKSGNNPDLRGSGGMSFKEKNGTAILFLSFQILIQGRIECFLKEIYKILETLWPEKYCQHFVRGKNYI
jgi:hypothetical protein